MQSVLIVGGGGREHAIIAVLAKSPRVRQLHAAPGNGGIAELAQCRNVAATDVAGVVALAKSLEVDWVFVAPDDPLVLGMVDALEAEGFKTFGPRKNAAILEGSKAFSKAFMARNNIPSADYAEFTDCDKAVAYIQARNSYPAVIKYDGLALGKGVIIAQDEAEAIAAIRAMLVENKFGDAGIIIEEFLQGQEVTVLAFTDGKTVVPMPPSTDHKRAFDGDTGPNTGGMGVVAGGAALPYWSGQIADECMKRIFEPTVKAMAEEGRAFKGCLYFGLMLTEQGVKVIEYNCRFGDPEAQAILPLLETDLFAIMEAIEQERLAELDIRFSNKASACVVMASGGYPEKYTTGYEISGLKKTEGVFHAGTKLDDSGKPVTSGGRVLAVTAVAEDLPTALARAYEGVECISFKDAHYRRDIGRAALCQECCDNRV
ncbi:MAG: phosphoribosylamine--glycine ligase [Oscillospiraceae bacterium]|nr:phosphoribosylamine--glycine ligase [Oscillospiraceae bacterium]